MTINAGLDFKIEKPKCLTIQNLKLHDSVAVMGGIQGIFYVLSVKPLFRISPVLVIVNN